MGADVNALNRRGESPLAWAKTDAMRGFLMASKKDADADVATKDGGDGDGDGDGEGGGEETAVQRQPPAATILEAALRAEAEERMLRAQRERDEREAKEQQQQLWRKQAAACAAVGSVSSNGVSAGGHAGPSNFAQFVKQQQADEKG
eukprot:327225-Pleurochrysis_carterae.AAC.1